MAHLSFGPQSPVSLEFPGPKNSNRVQRGPMKMLTRWMCVLVLAGCAAEAPEGSFVQNE